MTSERASAVIRQHMDLAIKLSKDATAGQWQSNGRQVHPVAFCGNGWSEQAAKNAALIATYRNEYPAVAWAMLKIADMLVYGHARVCHCERCSAVIELAEALEGK